MIIISSSSSYLNGIIIATRKQNVHGWMPLNHFHILCMSLQHCNTIKLVALLSFPNPNSFISSTCCKKSPRCIPWHTFDFIFMTLYTKAHTYKYQEQVYEIGNEIQLCRWWEFPYWQVLLSIVNVCVQI